MIKLENISVIYNKNTPYQHSALDSLNLNIKNQEFVVIIGANGAGKSTLMNVIAGSINNFDGKIKIDNLNISKVPDYERSKYISRVFQDPMVGTFSNLSIEENFALSDKRGKQRSITQALYENRRKKYREIVAGLGLGLEDRMTDPIGLLSGGQRQVLSLLMATLQPTKLLLLDEHTAALDPKMGDRVMEITENVIKKNKLTALMITHNMKHAAKYGTRTIVMKNGNIVHDISGAEKDKTCPYDLWEETHSSSPTNQ